MQPCGEHGGRYFRIVCDDFLALVRRVPELIQFVETTGKNGRSKVSSSI